jgi:hypothetical protein
MLAGLLQVDAVAWAIQANFALFTATLGADTPMHCQAEALLLARFANRTTHNRGLLLHYVTRYALRSGVGSARKAGGSQCLAVHRLSARIFFVWRGTAHIRVEDLYGSMKTLSSSAILELDPAGNLFLCTFYGSRRENSAKNAVKTLLFHSSIHVLWLD